MGKPVYSGEFHDLYLDFDVTEGIVLRRDGHNVYTNVPHLVVHHSPSGYEWGYGGSGPADLALNICELILTRLGYYGERQECFEGGCFSLAFALHQKFKWKFVSAVDREGGVIDWDQAVSWVRTRAGYRVEG